MLTYDKNPTHPRPRTNNGCLLLLGSVVLLLGLRAIFALQDFLGVYFKGIFHPNDFANLCV